MGYRYIDDVLLYTNDPSLTFDVLAAIYPRPLELKEEKHSHRDVTFLSTNNTLQSGRLHVSHSTKNWVRARQGLPLLKAITPHSSHVPPHMKMAALLGACHRAGDNTTPPYRARDIWATIQDHCAIGFPTGDVPRVWFRMSMKYPELTVVRLPLTLR